MPHGFLSSFWTTQGWELVHTIKRPGRPQELFSPMELPLSVPAQRYLAASYPDGLYRHQLESLGHWLQGDDVAITTGTASGKSVTFYAAAIEAIARDPGVRILAVYPLKALARDQVVTAVAVFYQRL